MIRNRNKPDILKYLRLYEIKVKSYSNNYIRKWNLVGKDMHKKTKREAENDIRMHIQYRTS